MCITRFLVLAGVVCALNLAPATVAQIASDTGDGVLNAPYRGTVDSLRTATLDLGFGEVMTNVEPTGAADSIDITGHVRIWVQRPDANQEAWDRSVLRLYRGVDACGPEVDLTATYDWDHCYTISSPDAVERFSFRAMGTKTLAPQRLDVHFWYRRSGQTNYQEFVRTVKVAPMTASFLGIRVESETFQYGVPLLEVSAGNARLRVPTGVTADYIGSPYVIRQRYSSATIYRYDVALPGAAESVFIQDVKQFRLGSDSSPYGKTNQYGTPWSGHLLGYRVWSSDVYAPDGSWLDYYYSGANSTLGTLARVVPCSLSASHPAAQQFTYDGSNRVIQIRDGASPYNVITLQRNADRIIVTTSPATRSWTIYHDTYGRVTGIVPGSGLGARYFKYPNSTDANRMYRVTQVRLGASDGGDPYNPDVGAEIMHKFVYDADGDLREEWRYVDGQLRKVVEHVVVSDFQRQRREWIGGGASDYRVQDFYYDNTPSQRLYHRLASVITHGGVAGGPPDYTTTYFHKIGDPSDPPNSAGTMVLDHVVMPDQTTVEYGYDGMPVPSSVAPNFGLRSKTTLRAADGTPLVTQDRAYELFFSVHGTNDRLFYTPRVVKVRDGRHDPNNPTAPINTEVTFDYENGNTDENGDSWNGEDSNQLRSQTGPTITNVDGTTRTPVTRYVYYGPSDPDPNDPLNVARVLKRVETDYAAGAHRDVTFTYDSMLRRTSESVGGVATQYQYRDDVATQDRIVVDGANYWTTTQFDPDGRVSKLIRYLNPGGTAGNFYQTESTYYPDGRLHQLKVDNKDQAGAPIAGELGVIVTEYAYDQIGRLISKIVDAGGIGQQSNFEYDWLGRVTHEYDTSGRGTKRLFDGRGLVTEEFPFTDPNPPNDEQYRATLRTVSTYDANGRVETVTKPTGAWVREVYDSFGRLLQDVRAPAPNSGTSNNMATAFEYDAANHVTRTTARDNVTIADVNSGDILSDTTAQYDEGGFNYETRQRLVAGTDSADDPLTQRKFDWAGNVIEEKSLGDATVSDRTITTIYDTAGRIAKVQDSLGGDSWYHDRDSRGNPTEVWTKLLAGSYAVTSMQYDALSRAFQITDPNDGTGLRHYRQRFYDSRGNLRRETAFTSSGTAKETVLSKYDNAGRLTQEVVLANAGGFAATPDPSTDRVIDYQYDRDGRLRYRTTYNNNFTTPLVTETTYDALGRVFQVTDPAPASTYTRNVYAANGRLDHREIYDGMGTRTISFGYDGHDRVTLQTEAGPPNIETGFELDGLDRPWRITNPRGFKTRTYFDLTGQRVAAIENEGGGALERRTDFLFNRLNQLIAQTAKNKDASGSALADQVTHYRYDALGRTLRVLYPDSGEDPATMACADCVRMTYDLAGRLTSRHDPDGPVVAFTHDDRGLLFTRATAALDRQDTYGYDALGRLTLADRGTPASPAAISHVTWLYTDLSDVLSEQQTESARTTQTVNYLHDQAGNRTRLRYPSGVDLQSASTALNRMRYMWLDAQPFAEYAYKGNGRLLDYRRTTTDHSGGDTVYQVGFDYDAHRRTNLIENVLEIGGTSDVLASYAFTHDDNGNPLTQTTVGAPEFAGDDRTFTVDALDRLTGTLYAETSRSETSVLDLVGNRHTYQDRIGQTTTYGPVNPANEYASVNGHPLSYDAAGNLAVDEDGRHYFYDEQQRLTEVHDPNGNVLARYTLDALGRRIVTEFGPGQAGGATFHYTYDGPNVIEEQETTAGGVTTYRYHVNGSQYVDERIATHEISIANGTQDGDARVADGAGGFTYYLHGTNYSVVGIGNASGSLIRSLDFTPGGDFPPYGVKGDTNCDGVVSFADINAFVQVLGNPSLACNPANCDINGDGVISFADINPFVACLGTSGCGTVGGGPPRTGTFVLHGRPVDVLPDGHILMNFRARYYDVKHGRWLQRDRSGYADGGNLYEAFSSNALVRTDPSGLDDVVQEGQDLVYKSRAFQWTFATGLGGGLVLIDHPDWPYAFIMRQQDAVSEFQTRCWERDFTHPYDIMQHATTLAVAAGTQSKVLAVFDKHPAALGWFDTRSAVTEAAMVSGHASERAAELRQLAQRGVGRQISGMGTLTSVAFTATMGALAAPTGLGGTAVDVLTIGTDLASGDLSLRGGALVITAAVGGALLHLRFADEAIGAGRAASGAGRWEAAAEGMSERAAAYQAKITGRPGQVYVLNGVKFDGLVNGVLVDAKGPGYLSFIEEGGGFKRWFAHGQKELLEQADRQVMAAAGLPIRWHVAEEGFAKEVRELLARSGFSKIQVVCTP